MISGSLLASFCHHLSCFSVADFWMFFGMVFFFGFGWNSDQKWYPKATAADSFWQPFSILFDSLPQGCLWRFLCSLWLPFGSTLVVLGTFFGSVLESKTFPFGTRICKASADYRRHYIYIYICIHIYIYVWYNTELIICIDTLFLRAWARVNLEYRPFAYYGFIACFGDELSYHCAAFPVIECM